MLIKRVKILKNLKYAIYITKSRHNKAKMTSGLKSATGTYFTGIISPMLYGENILQIRVKSIEIDKTIEIFYPYY